MSSNCYFHLSVPGHRDRGNRHDRRIRNQETKVWTVKRDRNKRFKENKKASKKQAENTMRKETTAKVAPETNIYENNGDGSLSKDTNNAVTNSNRDRAGSVKEDTCSTAVLGNEAQETDLK